MPIIIGIIIVIVFIVWILPSSRHYEEQKIIKMETSEFASDICKWIQRSKEDLENSGVFPYMIVFWHGHVVLFGVELTDDGYLDFEKNRESYCSIDSYIINEKVSKRLDRCVTFSDLGYESFRRENSDLFDVFLKAISNKLVDEFELKGGSLESAIDHYQELNDSWTEYAVLIRKDIPTRPRPAEKKLKPIM